MHKHECRSSSHLSEGFQGGRSSFGAKASYKDGGGDYLETLDNLQGVNLKQIGNPPGVFCVCFPAHPPVRLLSSAVATPPPLTQRMSTGAPQSQRCYGSDDTVTTSRPSGDGRTCGSRHVRLGPVRSRLFRNSNNARLTFAWWTNVSKAQRPALIPRQGFQRSQDGIERPIAGLGTRVNPPWHLFHRRGPNWPDWTLRGNPHGWLFDWRPTDICDPFLCGAVPSMLLVA